METSIRFLAAAAALAVVAGCSRHDDDDDDPIPPPPGSAVVFREDFSGSFPGSQWDILSGDPFTSGAEGNNPPSLILNPVDDSIVIRGDFVFSSADAFTLSFDTASFEVQAGSEFRFLVVAAGSGIVDASFETLPFDDEVFVSIMDVELTFELTPSTSFDFVEFTVDADGFATWRLNGVAIVSRAGFPIDLYEIDIETHGGEFTVIAVDNVMLTRP
jgi:hypothetical protein